ncbi:MAG: AbrB/MazE/SpoVT family DNA-binding domain-containing protein [Candidatus Aenigmarchaeota archaeon]|nr:AbrB/MazE/SpoVT family DNA-binding domain-containing protein [Candidatus Aenigmarchaeota archaeon]
MKCVCGGEAERVKLEVKPYGVSIGYYPGYRCNKCGEEWFDEKTAEDIEQKAKKLGLFGLETKGKVGVAGNSLVVRVPKHVAKFLGLKKGSIVRVEPEGKDKIIVEITRH